MRSEKLLVHLVIPAAGLEFDVFLPQDLPVADIAGLLSSSAGAMTNGAFDAEHEALLCSSERQEILPPQLTTREFGLRHGETLYLL